MMAHENSIKSYAEQVAKGSCVSWRKRVYRFMANRPGRSFTDRELIETFRARDTNLVRPEVTRLIQDGLLVECGKARCAVSGKTVRLSRWSGLPYFSRTNGGRR